ncbi:hypothetical protein SLEP1_g8739 [Rubroshorea leprosula]|uniref:Integrase catalytic domain-containing protein n=1 Tax=Rubroshorea leprosula TaxID=152421 RepID=A0AAV5IBY0_9ROSI|nr:hypothetical protein SLEP1_g8739 [Rubroshorea leprosula]
MGDDGQIKVIDMGTVCLQTNNGTKLALKDVKHALDIRLNLISGEKLDDAGYCSFFSDGQWKLTKGSLVVARGSKSSNLYLMQSSIADDSINVEAKLEQCVHCLAGRQKRVSFKNHPPLRKPDLLELVHFDVCGPLKTKDQVLDVFKQFQALVERQIGKKLKCIRTDNGGEYSELFDNYCKEQGIRHQKTPPKTPQLNGLAERMNKTLMERVRCLLAKAKLPRTFWVEALNTVAHVTNLSPTIALDNDVPDRVWCGKDVSYDHLRVFGCKAFVHVSKDERSKLDAKTRQCIFIGYGQDEFCYRLPAVETMVPNAVENHFQNDKVQDDIHDGHVDANDLAAPLNEVVNDQQDVPVEVPVDPLRRSSKERRPSFRYPSSEYVLFTDGGEPESYQEAMEREQKMEWLEAMKDEMKSLLDNHTFDLVKLPKDRKALKNRWVYRVKHEDGTLVPRYKARLVVKGFSQRKGVDFSEIFSPIVRMSSIRVVFGLPTRVDLEVEQMDVKTTFLHGDLDEEIYMEQPESFKVKGKEEFVCRLKKRIKKLRQELNKSFAMKDLGPAKQILGMMINCDRAFRKLWLSQDKYIARVLQRFEMDNAKVVSTLLAMHFKLGKN